MSPPPPARGSPQVWARYRLFVTYVMVPLVLVLEFADTLVSFEAKLPRVVRARCAAPRRARSPPCAPQIALASVTRWVLDFFRDWVRRALSPPLRSGGVGPR